MTAEDQSTYVRALTLCEFMTNVAYAMEFSGGLNEGLSDRMEKSVEKVREARDWMWDIGQMMTLSRPLPNGLHEALEMTENRALETLPKFKALMDEACDELARAAQRSKPHRDSAARLRLVRPTN
jgi:hypothetical protein